MPSTQDLTRRIKSVKSTRKITRAMQLVSASKMRKAQNATLSSRTYAELANQIIKRLYLEGKYIHPLMSENLKATKVGIILISSNKGLVGGFNTNLLNKVREHTQATPELITEIVAKGKKGAEGSARLKSNLVAQFPKYDRTESASELMPLAKFITENYLNGTYKQIFLAYNHFVSTLEQKPTLKLLLPFKVDTPNESVDQTAGIESRAELPAEILFEPTKQAVLDKIVPRILESQIYQAILESDASEHSARMIMMKNATESAEDLIDDLTLTFNQLRQNKITTELSEITAGKLALEN